ncbi:PREDICTED: kielin/chordin-like protein [Wasmannia auropunctata]|uniref:kielin/chordin-like protein n=1 Tax=Wasmannia auropunctata TaxID=64793 RepID=UPI0005EF9B13|nr:PREDICTED: kielin/chordin-like protein [Wasmannia auropunctata]
MTRRGREPRKFSYCSNMTRRGSRSRILICAYLAFVTVALAADQEKCDKTKCPGPLAYYESLGCSPVFANEGDCCATKYNCEHLKEKSSTKCYVNGKAYEIGEKLKDEDSNPCDIGCTCTAGYSTGIAEFNCAIVDCFSPPVRPGCYRRDSPLNCCPGEEVCPEKPEARAVCNVDGKEYKDGEHFKIESDPDLSCICQPGYEGKNVEPFCAKPKRPYCSPEFRNAHDIINNCPPVYYSSQSPQADCSVFSRCQNDNDTVIHNEDNSKSVDKTSHDENDVCHFGNTVMHRGDELNQATDYSSVCVKCVCEVPPLPTCQRLPDEECDVTNHAPFNH